MKKITYFISIFIAIVLIYILKPFVDDFKLKQKYSFKIDSVHGSLSNDTYKGKVLAIYFGYTFCPDICPTSLSSLAEALKSFDKEKVENNFKGLFISVDPKRDKLDNLNEYAKYFHSTFDAGTSNKENIDEIVKRYESYYEIVYLKDSSMDYSVAHTSYIYFFSKEGKFIKKVDHFSNPNELKKILSELL